MLVNALKRAVLIDEKENFKKTKGKNKKKKKSSKLVFLNVDDVCKGDVFYTKKGKKVFATHISEEDILDEKGEKVINSVSMRDLLLLKDELDTVEIYVKRFDSVLRVNHMRKVCSRKKDKSEKFILLETRYENFAVGLDY